MDLQNNKQCPFFHKAAQLSGANNEENDLLQLVVLGEIYEHYSGKRYKVVGIFRHSEDLELYVAYEVLYEPNEYGAYWVRPLAMFLETITIDGIETPRFKQVIV